VAIISHYVQVVAFSITQLKTYYAIVYSYILDGWLHHIHYNALKSFEKNAKIIFAQYL